MSSPGYQVRLATADDADAIRRFNQRLREGGVHYQLPLIGTLPHEVRERAGGQGQPVYREMFLALEGTEVRAGLLLSHSGIWTGGREVPFCWLQLPISEGLVDPRHGAAFILLLSHTLARAPFLMSLGVGSLDEKYAQVLLGLKWRHAGVPFLFYPVRPGRVARELPYVRRRRYGGLAGAALAYTGVAAALQAALAAHRRLHRRRGVEISVEPRFGPWADELYVQARGDYGAVVARDAETLNVRYPPDDPRYTRLRLRDPGGRELGWVVVIHARMERSKHFGNLHVGTLLDGFSRAADVRTVVQAGLDHLVGLGVDLIVGNWSHGAWRRACRAAGFVRGPTNFFLFVSQGAAPIREAACPLDASHFARGDGDVPAQLLPPRC